MTKTELDRIKDRMRDCKLSQSAMAKNMRYSRSYINGILNGSIKADKALAVIVDYVDNYEIALKNRLQMEIRRLEDEIYNKTGYTVHMQFSELDTIYDLKSVIVYKKNQLARWE